ncbi:TonB-linked SusC/RagA family outer membrane protein [Flavobacterium cutihirudinis]|uniref:TonB-linked SusC/RagA family outer membrane protein n=1 Tax=Flavobacterium cutihirudinis TaxID=1265740 RepID=A0A3D9FMJ5_9FLAO|nr:SusC/RagA family TonB-linked outer membrane protein [Flavobacterium cutihirudinis]RED19666.1 TonB-linked SusC/RagA family outer membrane protein [Flavobacterium cutihirudinis]
MKLKFNGFLVLLLVLVAQLTFAQERAVSGIVSDNAGMPLPGVSVLVKGTKSGTQTDFDGKFSIKASSSQVLVFSYIGMKTQEIAASSSVINVKLAGDAQELEGVVVTTALGVKREKKSLGYATQEVKGGDLRSGTASGNFLNELSGKVAGVNVRRNTNFGGSTSAISRGVKAINQSNEMLIVIDGMPINNANNTNDGTTAQSRGAQGYDYGNNGMDINPEDIESVNVLKGAAASALYGYLAGNGVLMITTKKGKAKKGLGITVSSEVVTGTPDKSTFLKYQKAYGAGYGGSFGEQDIDGDGNVDLVVAMGDDASVGDPFDSSLNVYQWDAFSNYPGNANYGKATPWVGAKNDPNKFFKSSLSLVNSISFEDANDKTNLVFNYSNTNQTGVLPNSELKKNNFSLKVNHQFTDRLSLSTFANFSNNTTVGRNMTGYSDNLVSGFRQWWQTNVDIKQLEQAYNASGGQNITWNRLSTSNGFPAYWNNPYFDRYKNYQNDSRNRFVGYANFTYKIAEWVSATAKISTDSYSEIREERLAVGSVGKTFGINAFNEMSGYQRYNGNFSEQNYDLLLNFKKNFGEDFNLTGVAGGTVRRNYFNQITASTEGGLIIPGLYSLDNSVSASPYPYERETKTGVNSYFVSASLGYKDMLFLDATSRRDAFSQLPEGNNSLFSNSISGSWVFTKLVNASWLTFGKIRGGYSESPLGTPTLALVDTYEKINSFNGQQQYSVNSVKNNPNLEPIKTKTQELGLEMQFLNRRIGFDLSLYKNVNEGEAIPVPYSTATGVSQRYVNAATIENKGIEVQFNATPFKTNDFAWDITVNWSKNDNTVTALADGVSNLQVGGSYPGGVTLNAVVGQPFGILKGTDYTYAADGQKIVNPSTGRYVINTSTNNVIGDINPDWIGGIRNKFSYKSLSFSFLIDMKKGGDIFSTDQWYGVGTGLTDETAGYNDLGNPMRNTLATGGGIILPGVYADGTPNTTRTAYSTGGAITNAYSNGPRKEYVYDAGFIKLREVNITYTLPSSLVQKMKLVDAKISLIGSNLWIIDKNLPDADPESGLGSNIGSAGLSIGSLPTTRNIGCNLTIKF